MFIQTCGVWSAGEAGHPPGSAAPDIRGHAAARGEDCEGERHHKGQHHASVVACMTRH